MAYLANNTDDCRGHKVLKYLPWNLYTGKNFTSSNQQNKAGISDEWGFIICNPSVALSVAGEPDLISLYGVIGSIQNEYIQNSCYGIQLAESDPDKALSIFSLACGLSIIEKAALEIGDTVVVTGANVLALRIIEAASLQGARTMCLVPNMESAYLSVIQKIADAVIEFQFNASFDSEFESFEKAACGKIIYIDAIGIPSLINYMVTRLKMFGGLILCRQDLDVYYPLDIYRDVHKKSAWIHYWNILDSTIEITKMVNLCKRAAKLYECNRVISDAKLPSNLEESF